MIPQNFIQDLLHRVDIVDVIDRHVKLKRAGANFVACCPFHSEKSPSFTVSQTKQFYHCFGCGAHGTAVGFLMEYSGLGFVDAVKELAQGVGMMVPDIRAERGERPQRPRGESEEGEDLYAVMLTAAQFYRNALKDAPQAIAYLKKRGLSGDIAKKFGVGYAAEGWQNLEKAFADYRAKALTTVGLVKQNDEGRRYDVFRDRVMFPIVDVRGNVIGFGGRVLESGEPKYLNSPETPLFEKGRELYGLYQARRAIRDAGRVVVVEGYMDVVALAQYGVEYAVATLGTATTPMHVQKLLRQTDEIVYCFDGDAAGRRAAWRALENSLGQLVDGKQIRFLFLPQEDDPDSYVRAHGKEAFEKLLDNATPLSQFLLSELTSRVDRTTDEGRVQLLKDAQPLVAQIAAPMLSLMLRKRLAELTGLSQQELDAQFKVKSQPAPAPARRQAPARPSRVRNVLELLVVDPSLARLTSRAQLKADANAGVGAGPPNPANADGLELRALDALLEALEAQPLLRSFGEYFRGTEFAALFESVEAGGLRFQEMGFDAEELKAELDGAWQGLVRERQQMQLAEQSRSASWRQEDMDKIRLIKQIDNKRPA